MQSKIFKNCENGNMNSGLKWPTELFTSALWFFLKVLQVTSPRNIKEREKNYTITTSQSEWIAHTEKEVSDMGLVNRNNESERKWRSALKNQMEILFYSNCQFKEIEDIFRHLKSWKFIF